MVKETTLASQGRDLRTARALLPQGRCPSCRYQIHVLEERAFAVIKTAVIKADLAAGKVYGKCPKCKCWLTVPLRYMNGSTSVVGFDQSA